MNRLSLKIILLGLSFFTAFASAHAAATEGDTFFEKRVRPILIEHCYECHSQKAGQRKGGLWIDRKSGWKLGGDSGPAIIPGDANKSLLIQAVRYESLEMPPKGKLPTEKIRVLEDWIRHGAHDPRTTPGLGAERKQIDIKSGRKFWSFQPVRQHPLPKVANQDWPENTIDHFVLAKLEAKGLRPAADAERETILRRLTFALTGLPPTRAEQTAFLKDESPVALETVVDRLLSSTAFSERWARHWLDIVRYSDTSGGGGSQKLPDAWKLRDYVIDAFHNDKPMNQLIREHIAGDLLSYGDHADQVNKITATGFLVLGPHNYGGQDRELLALEIVDEQIDTIGKAFLGMTIGCARCHDHKFDPIPTSDYYALAGIFLSTRSVVNEAASSFFVRPLPLTPKEEAQAAHDAKRLSALPKEIADLKQQIAKPGGPTANKEKSDERKAALKAKEDELKQLNAKKKVKRPSLMCVEDAAEPVNTTIRVRGQPRNHGAKVNRGVLQIATPAGTALPKISQGSGRLELANWISSEKNPLTARVLANRIWQHLLGHGLVRTPDNFGTTGSLPTHPELLDYLALQLVRNNWSARQLIREIVLSRTWRMNSSNPVSRGPDVDPENHLLWRANKRRLDAEALRDSILKLSGTLDPRRGGPSLPADFKSEFEFVHKSMKRSIYIPVFRNQPHEIFKAFDFANPSFVVGKRFQSTIPTQALFLLNSPFIHEQATSAANLLLSGGKNSPSEIDKTYRHILGRGPRSQELKMTLDFLTANDFSTDAKSSLIRSLFSCVDFQFIH